MIDPNMMAMLQQQQQQPQQPPQPTVEGTLANLLGLMDQVAGKPLDITLQSKALESLAHAVSYLMTGMNSGQGEQIPAESQFALKQDELRHKQLLAERQQAHHMTLNQDKHEHQKSMEQMKMKMMAQGGGMSGR